MEDALKLCFNILISSMVMIFTLPELLSELIESVVSAGVVMREL